MKRTALRELLRVIARPDIISFAGGLPAAEPFPVARVKEAVNAVLDRNGGQRRLRLIELLRKFDGVVVEDNPYGDLRYSGQTLPNLLELDMATSSEKSLQGRIIYTGTFSKVLMPGLRVGWVAAAPEVIEKLVQAKQAADLHTSTLCQ